MFVSFLARYRYAFVALAMVSVAQLLAGSVFADTTPDGQLASSCAFGKDIVAGMTRIISGLVVVLILVVALASIMNRGSSGSGGGSALMGVMVGTIDFGAALFVGIGFVATVAAIVVTAAGLPACK